MALESLLFTREHEWLKLEGGSGRVGITEYAQHELGDVVYVELPAKGKEVKKGDPCANIESVKAVSDVYSPVSGTVVEVNPQLRGPSRTGQSGSLRRGLALPHSSWTPRRKLTT